MLARLQAPAKTFLVGEYLVLEGGPGWILTTQPCFEFQIRMGRGELAGIHPNSPAGRLWSEHRELLHQTDARFVDPYEGRGGLGASGAQFLFVWTVIQSRRQDPEILIPDVTQIPQLLKEYRKYSTMEGSTGPAPSGADMVAQLQGRMTEWCESEHRLRRWDWPLPDVGFFLVRTGDKIATHEHLSGPLRVPVCPLQEAVALVRSGFENRDPVQLVEGLRDYRRCLMDQNWVHPRTQALVETLERVDGVRVAKGCGALGVDIVLVVVDKSQKPLIQRQIQAMSLEICGSEESLAEQGLSAL